MNKAKATIYNLRIAPRKVRLVSDTLKGKSVNESMAQLQLMPWRSVPFISKLLKSATANAKNKNMDVNKLFIESITVNQGPMLKRFLPRAQGRATPIQKKMSHLSITLGEKENLVNRYTIYEVKKEKKERIDHKDHDHKPKAEIVKKVSPESKPGFLKKMFQRKSI